MSHPYDNLTVQELRAKDCMKWSKFGSDVLPLWVADMDFPIADEIKDAIRDYLGTNNFGYPEWEGLPGLKETATARQAERYSWRLEPDDIHIVNGIVPSLFLGVAACSSVGEDVLMHSPVYGPFMMAVEKQQRNVIHNELKHDGTHYRIDFDALEEQVTPATRLFMLCNPQNPVGRVFTRSELERLADFCLRHRLWVVSDELHSDLVYSGHEHIPFATLSDDIAERTLTLFGPTKTFNIAGLKAGFVASKNHDLLARFKEVGFGRVGYPNVLGQAATIAAYQHGGAWLEQTLNYLEANRDFVAEFVRNEMPQVGHTSPEGTYLALLNFRELGIENAEIWAAEEAKVGLNDGAWFGPGGEGQGRLNFATARYIVEEALGRIKRAADNTSKTSTSKTDVRPVSASA